MLYKYRMHMCGYEHHETGDFSVLNLWPYSVCSLVDFGRKQVEESRAG